MEGEDDRRVTGEELVEIRVGEPVRVLALRLQFHDEIASLRQFMN